MEAAERRAETRTRLNYTTKPDGSLHYSGVLPPVEGAILKTVLDAKSSPKRRDQAGGWTDEATGQRLTAEQVRGEAFRDLIGSLDPDTLGQHGGMPVSVFVTMTHQELIEGLGHRPALHRRDHHRRTGPAPRLRRRAHPRRARHQV